MARGVLRPGVRDRADQPLGPDAVAVVAVPDQPELGLPRHPGPARGRGHGCSAASAGQALDRLPEAAGPTAEGGPGPRAARPRAALDRSARRGSDLPARHRAGERRAVVPVALQLPPHPLRARLGRDRRAGRPHRGEAPDHPSRPGQRRRQHRPRPDHDGARPRRDVAPRTAPDHVGRHGSRGARHRRGDSALAAQGVGPRRPFRGRPAGRADQPLGGLPRESSRPPPARRTG